ncbi:PD40 domain-containing protein [Candidatus Sumerlaeota bacterium]|nr:PD40 domain-containing protein [Candidatus Sumerlaeota bacterium]
MSRRRFILVIVVAAAIASALLVAYGWRQASQDHPDQYVDTPRLPQIRPDYGEIVIPPNIAPLNFLVEEPGIEFRVRIHGAGDQDILIASHDPSIVIPQQPWRELLLENRGGKIGLDIYVKGQDGRWSRFKQIENTVAQEKIDSHLVYRLLGPVCNYFNETGVYQRNLENFDVSPILTSHSFGGCVNCHSFKGNDPKEFSLHIRPGPYSMNAASGMIRVRDGHAVRLQTKSAAAPRPPGYIAWHPDGLAVAYSMNKPAQVFRAAGDEIRDVLDFYSDLAVANTETGASSSSPDISDPGRLETFPCWSADGKEIYYCSAQSKWGKDNPPDPESMKKLMFDLVRVEYNAEDNTFGPPETVLAASDTGMSITEPRASPDGRYLLCCMLDYGMFPLFRSSADLYLMDLKTGDYRRLECNSDSCEAWHSWSSNSRWIVFSSKRDNGLLARPYFSYIDAEGRAHKPFVLPQKDPAFYDAWLKTYNVPELITGPVKVSQKELLQAIFSVNASADGVPQPGGSWQATKSPQMH